MGAGPGLLHGTRASDLEGGHRRRSRKEPWTHPGRAAPLPCTRLYRAVSGQVLSSPRCPAGPLSQVHKFLDKNHDQVRQDVLDLFMRSRTRVSEADLQDSLSASDPHPVPTWPQPRPFCPQPSLSSNPASVFPAHPFLPTEFCAVCPEPLPSTVMRPRESLGA